ncbi:hypothetical protein ABZ863_11135 [Saccharomonospora sp. NPDC046836]|uniref:hypothetical protein n=1 Tax=Saccharomonospora sp. NPDC046836 TaxID=3156921 RepID=UPI0033C1CC98
MLTVAQRTPQPEPSGERDREPQDIESPIPLRSDRDQEALTKTLLGLPTLAERLSYLLEHESYFYELNREPVIDPDVIAAAPRGLKRKLARVPVVARWVEQRTGRGFTKSAMYQYRDGERPKPRADVANALEEFWRLEHRLLDPTVPASKFEDRKAEAAGLDELERRAYELMTEVGFQGVRPREIKRTLGETGDASRYAFLAVLEAISRDRASRHPADTPTPPSKPPKRTSAEDRPQ